MAAERPIQETAAGFLSCIYFCVNSGMTPQVKRAMAPELQSTAHLVRERGLGGKEFVDSFLQPSEANMIARFGYPESSQPFDEFAEVFKGVAGAGLAFSRGPA